MTVCPSCGDRNVDDRDFCLSCGSYLRWEDEAVVAAASAGTEQEAAAPGIATAPVMDPAPDPVTEPLPTAPADPGPPIPPAVVTFRDPGGVGQVGGRLAARVAAGAEIALPAVVRNQSGVVDAYTLRVVGWPESWWSIAPATVHLVPLGAGAESPEQEVLVHLHPPRAPQAEARSWDLQLAAVSNVRHSIVASAPVTVTIEPYEQFDVRMRPERATGDDQAEYTLPVRNLGNAPLRLALHGEDADGEVRFAFSPERLEVPPGGETRAAVRVRAPQPRSGPARERRLTIHADADGGTRAVTATFAQRPQLTPAKVRNWRWLLALVAALLLAAGAFMSWTGDGLTGLCAGADACLRYDVFAARFLETSASVPDAGALQGLFDFVASAGVPILLLAVIVLLGVRTGAAAWSGGVVSILLLVAYLVVAQDAGAGVWVALLGGAAAVGAGLLATRTA